MWRQVRQPCPQTFWFNGEKVYTNLGMNGIGRGGTSGQTMLVVLSVEAASLQLQIGMSCASMCGVQKRYIPLYHFTIPVHAGKQPHINQILTIVRYFFQTQNLNTFFPTSHSNRILDSFSSSSWSVVGPWQNLSIASKSSGENCWEIQQFNIRPQFSIWNST